MTINIQHILFNRGILFFRLPVMMLFASKQNHTESSFLLKMSKLLGNKPDRKYDDHSLRQIRKGNNSEKHFERLFGKELFKKIKDQIEQSDIDQKNIGGWFFLYSFLQNIEALNEEEQEYIDFLLNLCEIDKSYLISIREKDPDIKKNIGKVNQSIRDWLLLPSFDLNDDTNKQMGAELIVALLLHWAALFEHFLLIEYEQDNGTPSFKNYLPTINKKGKLECSNEVFLTRFKNLWASKNYSRPSIPWTTLYRDIERAKNKNRPNFETFRIAPNTDKIKKTLTRWRNGEGFLSIEAIKKELLVLYQPYDPEYFDSTLFVIVFIQLFDSIQRELQKEGFSDEFITESFARYQSYLKLVERRFNEFKKTNAVKP